MRHPIPSEALDDRLGFIGTSGSGKTYNAGTAVEILLSRKARAVVIDPLGVWWGLRLLADGKKPSNFNVVIFGGPHGDLPLTDVAGALIGETAATMAESCIIDLSELKTKAAERRFMVAFLDAIYRKATSEPFHLVVDEADLFAPQKPADGDQMLLAKMEEIVRRGRVKGFIPWLISQRPAVLNKNVLSQVDGMLAFKLTGSHDRDALDSWIEGQADKAQGKAIKDSLPALQIGQGVVWIPGRGVLQPMAKFPAKVTFDSSRTPKRGEKAKRTAKLKPIDIGKLKDKLATVEAEVKASDPKALRAELEAAKRELQKLQAKPAAAAPAADPSAIKKAEERGFEQAKKKLSAASERAARESYVAAVKALTVKHLIPLTEYVAQMLKDAKLSMPALERIVFEATPAKAPAPARQAAASTVARAPRAVPTPAGDGSYNRPQMKVLQALAMWRALGHEAPSREMVAAIAGYSPSSGGYNNLLGGLATAGAIDKPMPGHLSLLADGVGVMSPADGRDLLLSKLTKPQKKLVAALNGNAAPTSRDDLGQATGYSASSGGFNNLIGSLGTLGILVKPQQGFVCLSDWAQQLLEGYELQVAA